MILTLILFLNHSGLSQGLIISTGTSIFGTGGNLVLWGNVVNDGYFSNDTNTVIFAGTVQSLGGTSPVLFNNLTVAAGSTTSMITAGQTLKGILVSNNTLNANGNITLLSTATNTALIDGSGTGQVYGNVTMQRYLPSGFGYKYFSSPFQAATVSEFGDDMDLLATFPTFYSYDENRGSSGWVTYTAPAGVLDPLHGYAVNFGPGVAPVTVDVTGVVNSGNLLRTVYNHDSLYTKGFNLVGNPYPSPIDWDAASGWTKTDIDDALYYFKAGGADHYSGTYSTYIEGISSDGLATNIIPSMQAFFIHITDGVWPVTGTLGINNTVRITDYTQQFIKSGSATSRPILRISANYTDNPGTSDPMVIYFDEKGSNEFDGRNDALKLMNTDRLVPNFYSITPDGYNLSINALPLWEDSLLVIPVGLRTERDGNLLFRIMYEDNLSSETKIYLSDNLTGSDNIINMFKGYNIYLNAGEYNNRFSLVLVKGTSYIHDNRSYKDLFSIYSSKGGIVANIILLPGNTGTMTICNISGQLVFIKDFYEIGYHEFNLELKTGIYLVNFLSGNVRDTKKLFILGR